MNIYNTILTSLISIGIWLLMVLAAILNGGLRDRVLTPLLGAEISLPLSGITLSLLILTISYFLIPRIGRRTERVYIAIGLSWVALTLGFEYLFGHYVLAKPWLEIHQVFNIFEGNLFSLALLTSALAPWLVTRVKHLNQQ